MTLLIGDCIELMKTLDADSVDAIVTDPPYGLSFMGKEWDGFGTPLGFQTWSEQWAREALRVLKPGGHLLAFGGTRMYHRLAAGIEDAGFEIRDTLMWLYGSGFPKSLDVSKAIDKAAGAEREVVARNPNSREQATIANSLYEPGTVGKTANITAPSTEAAKKWQGWGTALKPAVEPIVLARKPLIGTVAANVLMHGTGALNIDASRIGTEQVSVHNAPKGTFAGGEEGRGSDTATYRTHTGRWAANILLDEEAAAMLDEQSGGASRFFYVAKASRSERNAGLEGLPEVSAEVMSEREPDSAGLVRIRADGSIGENPYAGKTANAKNIHPTVKPVALMKYLIRLVTPKGGTVLDPFLGSGTTAVAAIEEGVKWIGCEKETEYVAIINGRIAAARLGLGL
jgi:DNA modification methylase